MTKNLFIGLLFLVTVFLSVFASIKREEANHQKLQAIENQILALENHEKAKWEEQKATEAVARAFIASRKAEELQAQLDNCK